ncbi:MAG: hypothetical protein JSV08_03025 [Acidobacteriota bacterium]|nr:MAG: hypothetical protein JSV08_03025 [Acidobacteriota bacterium]
MEETEAKVFRIAPWTRFLSAASLAVLGAALVALLAFPLPARPLPSVVLVSVFFLLSVVANVSNFGDLVVLDDERLVQRNRFLEALGLGRRTELEWKDVAQIVPHGRRTLFVLNRKGRRYVFDGMHPFEDFKEELYARSAGFGAPGQPPMPPHPSDQTGSPQQQPASK